MELSKSPTQFWSGSQDNQDQAIKIGERAYTCGFAPILDHTKERIRGLGLIVLPCQKISCRGTVKRPLGSVSPQVVPISCLCRVQLPQLKQLQSLPLVLRQPCSPSLLPNSFFLLIHSRRYLGVCKIQNSLNFRNGSTASADYA